MFIIKVSVRQFNYYLRFDKNQDEAFAEGLKNNATTFSKEEAELLVEVLKSEWPLKIIPYE